MSRWMSERVCNSCRLQCVNKKRVGSVWPPRAGKVNH